jgi:MFS family permease
MAVLGPAAGVFIDRLNRGKLIAWTDIAGGILLAAAALMFFLLPSVPQNLPVLILSVFIVTLGTGLLDTFSQPAITASLPDLVPKDKLEAANGLNLSGIHLSFLTAQGLAGLLFKLIGAPLLIALNALTYLWAGISELWIITPEIPVKNTVSMHPFRRFFIELKEGFSYVWAHKGLRASIIVFTILNFFISPLLGLMVFIVEDHIGLGPEWLGFLMAIYGGGALLGFALAGTFPVKGSLRLWTVNAAFIIQSLMVVCILAFTATALEIIWFFSAGIFGAFGGVHTNTLLQTAAPAELQGRVQSLVNSLSVGVMPLGMALSGIAWDLSGGRVWLVVGLPAILMTAASAGALFFKDYRAFYRGDTSVR